jgi:SAM-dependent methyltransferase
VALSDGNHNTTELNLLAVLVKLEDMGRFASTIEFYSRYREPYPPNFFSQAAERLGFTRRESLLDVGCGPASLAIGFAPYIGDVTALDPEPGMMAAARAAAEQADVAVSFVHGRIEQFAAERRFEVVTIGRALHWLDRNATLPLLERIVPPAGHILICGSVSVESESHPWVKPYDDVRRAYADDPDQKLYRIDDKEWFAGSKFREGGTVKAAAEYKVTIADMTGRALSKSNTSAEVLGERRSRCEAEIAAVLEPFAQDGVLEDRIVAYATVFVRQG